MKFCVKDFFIKCDQIRSFLGIWLHLLKKSLLENFIFRAVLATKCLFLTNKNYMVRPTLVYMNLVELKYYPFMISLNKCAGSYNVLLSKMCVSKETTDINLGILAHVYVRIGST